MALEDFQMMGGVIFKQVKIDVTNKQEQTIVAASSGKKAKVFRLVVTCNQACKFVIRTSTDELRKIFFSSDVVPFIEESSNFKWPVFAGNLSADLQIYQSDLASVDACAYVQYRYE